MNAILTKLLDEMKDPDTLDSMAVAAEFIPAEEGGPIIAAGLHLIATWIRQGKSIDEVKAIVARASGEAQSLASDWHD